MQCAQFRSLQSHLRVCSCRALARMPGRGARTTPAARVIAGSTRLTNAKRTCGGLVDFASKITQARPTVMRDDKPGGTISASVKTKSPCPSDRSYHSADLPSGLRCDPTHILACRSVIFNKWRRSRSENRNEETSRNRVLLTVIIAEAFSYTASACTGTYAGYPCSQWNQMRDRW